MHEGRKLIVDTDLGRDDLVALAILRLQQCLMKEAKNETYLNQRQLTNFHLCGVVLTYGVSSPTNENASLLRRLLPPDIPVFVSSVDENSSWNKSNLEKPAWWTRTSSNVEKFLSSLPNTQSTNQSREYFAKLSAEEFLSNNLNDPSVDILCMAPLTTVSKAFNLFKQRNPGDTVRAKLIIMGGIRFDSQWTKRGQSTAPFGYHENRERASSSPGDQLEQMTASNFDDFGEFNFALNIEAAQSVLANIPAQIITLEACTLPPHLFRYGSEAPNLISLLQLQERTQFFSNQVLDTNIQFKEMVTARDILYRLLLEFGTDETQWDSISAAIYCNIFGPSRNKMVSHVCLSELQVSDLGVLSFPCHSENSIVHKCVRDPTNISDKTKDKSFNDQHLIDPAFTCEDEAIFFQFLKSILFGPVNY